MNKKYFNTHHYSNPQHTVGDVSIHQCSYQWSTATVHTTPAQSPAVWRGSEWCHNEHIFHEVSVL